jgi:DNA polymerase-4/DNA polymerase V
MRRFTPQVEEYSIDEAFADITGMRRALRASYETIALNMKAEIARELGITVSVGLSLTKVLAKVASKHQKPDGFTPIPGRMIAKYLEYLPVEKIWGIGHATTNYLNKMGVRTALEFARLPEDTVRKRFTKPGMESWRELRGESVYPCQSGRKEHLCLHQQDQDLFTPKQRCGLPVCPSDEESGIGLSQGQRLSSGGKADRGLPEEKRLQL